MNTDLEHHKALANEFSRAWGLQIMNSYVSISDLTVWELISMVRSRAEAKNLQKYY